MELLSIVLLTVAATADSFTIGFNYGVKQVHIRHSSNLIISIICLLGTLAAMLAGRMLGSVTPAGLADTLGAAALILFGLYMLLRALIPSSGERYDEAPHKVDKDNSKVIELRESFLVGILLAINNMGLGMGAGMAGVSVLLTPPICALASFGFVRAGCLLGGKLSGVGLSKKLEILSALLVLLLGLMSMVL